MLRPSRIALIHGSLVLFAGALMVRAAQVQLWQRHEWVARAQRQHFAAADVPAPRGDIYDVSGVPLAQSREVVRLGVAPRELKDRRAAWRALSALGLPRQWADRATDTSRVWVSLPGTYLPGEAASLTAMRGVYAESAIERVYTPREATRRLIGRVDQSGAPLEGLELTLDSLLRGRSGKAQLVRDSRGTHLELPLDTSVAAKPGDAVVLTINQELQEISERALGDAISRLGAQGGDIVILDPHDGEIRAMASKRRDPRSSGSPAVSEPFEPGSTLKPLIASRLLALGKARPDEVVNTENGRYTVDGRTITDTHAASALSLSDVIRWSSNIGIVKFASRLTPREEFETLRDFGFGSPTGLPFPGEAAGLLRSPAQWSKQSAASLAMGYELSVTALQLVSAYAAVGNGGELLEPALVKEIRSPDGTVKYRHTRRVVRRVMDARVANAVLRMMVAVVEAGTGKDAALGRFTLAGKSGTARRTAGRRGYVSGAYTASFVGLFPADNPQYVFLVKLDNPQGEYYGGKTAAPISKIVLEAAIAARDAALDRGALAWSEASRKTVDSRSTRPAVDTVLAAATDTAQAATDGSREGDKTVPFVFTLPQRASGKTANTAMPRPIPEVRGLPVRAAVRALHRAGFRVQVAGLGPAESTSPSAGSVAPGGALIRLVGAP